MTMVWEDVGYAVRITTSDGTIYRWAKSGKQAHDTNEDYPYDDRIVAVRPPRKGITWERPLSAPEKVTVVTAQDRGDLWAPAVGAFAFKDALLEQWYTVDAGDGLGFVFDSSADPDWVGTCEADQVSIDEDELELSALDVFEPYLDVKAPTDVFDEEDNPDKADRTSGSVPLWIGTAAGGALFVTAKCIDVGEIDPGDPLNPIRRAKYKVVSARDYEGNDTLGPESISSLVFLLTDPRFIPVLPSFDASKDGPFRLIAASDWQSGDGVAHLNVQKPEAKTVPRLSVTAINLTEGTFELDMPLRTDDQDPNTVGGDAGTDALGRTIATDVNPQSDILMIRGSGQRVRNPDDDASPLIYVPPLSDLMWHYLTRLAGLPAADRLVTAEWFSTATWASGTNNGVAQDPGGAYVDRATEIRSEVTTMAFEGHAALVKRRGKLRLEAFEAAPATTPTIELDPTNIAGKPKVIRARWVPTGTRVVAHRDGPPDDPEYLARDADVGSGEPTIEYDARWTALSDTATSNAFRLWTEKKLSFHAANEMLIDVLLQPPMGEVLTLMRLHPNDWVTLWWDASEPRFSELGFILPWVAASSPINCKVVTITPDVDAGTVRARLRWQEVDLEAPAARTVTSSTYVSGGIDYTVAIDTDTAGADGAVTLPDARTVEAGRVIVVKRTGAYDVTVSAAAGLVDGEASLTLSGDLAAIELQSDGTNWQAIDQMAWAA